MLLAQKGDQVFDQAQALFVKVFSRQVSDEPLDGFCASFAQSEIGSSFWFVTQQQAEGAEAAQSMTQELPASDVEVGGGDVERVTVVLGQEIIENIGHFILLVVDDEGDGNNLPVFAFQPDKQPLFLLVFSSGFLKSFDAVPTMCSCKNLDIELTGHTEDKTPYIGLRLVIE